jgi:hypothetical protein
LKKFFKITFTINKTFNISINKKDNIKNNTNILENIKNDDKNISLTSPLIGLNEEDKKYYHSILKKEKEKNRLNIINDLEEKSGTSFEDLDNTPKAKINSLPISNENLEDSKNLYNIYDTS